MQEGQRHNVLYEIWPLMGGAKYWPKNDPYGKGRGTKTDPRGRGTDKLMWENTSNVRGAYTIYCRESNPCGSRRQSDPCGRGRQKYSTESHQRGWSNLTLTNVGNLTLVGGAEKNCGKLNLMWGAATQSVKYNPCGLGKHKLIGEIWCMWEMQSHKTNVGRYHQCWRGRETKYWIKPDPCGQGRHRKYSTKPDPCGRGRESRKGNLILVGGAQTQGSKSNLILVGGAETQGSKGTLILVGGAETQSNEENLILEVGAERK